ncbi:hypothetical protein SETIT_9G330100v2 [Setaria italica]|uniref:Uncharacterized protein n=1 Tax=Setaria italica TaxID=4555 RepID=K4AIQ2_SETIT|nr:hypothetical protein SETIT_9G330100v2 [Setaria italica]
MARSWSSSSSMDAQGTLGRGLQSLTGRAGGCSYWFWAEDPYPEFIQDMLRDLKILVWGLTKQNRELRDRLGDATLMVKEHKGEVRALKVEMEANASRKEEESDAMRDRVCRMEKELVVYKFLIKCCVVLVLVVVWNKWFS